MAENKPFILSGEAKVVLDVVTAVFQKSAAHIISEALFSYVRSMPDADRTIIEAAVERALGSREGEPVAEQSSGERALPKATFKYSRLCFKKDVIECLGDNDEFRVETPMGAFQMSKTEFRRDFGNVRNSRSYKESGFYTYPTLPLRADRYRLPR